jgi:hypothetical protein
MLIRTHRVRIAMVTVLVAVLGMPALVGPVPAAGAVRGAAWKGAETLTPVALIPNFGRCGSLPNLEARYAGVGIDTGGGAFSVIASGCLNLGALRVFDMEVTDTYTATLDRVRIEPDDFTLVLDSATCVASNPVPIAFRVAGGTGRFKGARGGGHFDFALNHPACNGLVIPAHIWFHGQIR